MSITLISNRINATPEFLHILPLMLPTFGQVKNLLEQRFSCKIYRNSLPVGADLTLDIKRRLKGFTPQVIFDVGANVGQSALKYVELYPNAQIHSFEPVQATFQQLQEAVKDFCNVKTRRLAVGATVGSVFINVNPLSVVSSLKVKRPEDRQEEVPLQTVDVLAKEAGIDTIDLLKIDTEGFDLEVLRGSADLLREQRITLVQCEVGPGNDGGRFASFAETLEYMHSLEYQLFGIYDQQPEWNEYRTLWFWNAVFIKNRH